LIVVERGPHRFPDRLDDNCLIFRNAKNQILLCALWRRLRRLRDIDLFRPLSIRTIANAIMIDVPSCGLYIALKAND
jgi:hypothetical protein